VFDFVLNLIFVFEFFFSVRLFMQLWQFLKQTILFICSVIQNLLYFTIDVGPI
jgi:hypothetical protein